MQRIHSCVEVLSTDEIRAIHNASLRTLERVGIRVPQEECLARCRKAGAFVEDASGLVRIPAALMEETVSRFRTAATTPSRSEPARLEGVISTQLQVVDYAARTRRPGTLDDVLKGIALVQWLRHFPTANAVVTPSDVPGGLADLLSFQLLYSYSRKPGGTYVLTPFTAVYILEMAKVMGRSVWFLLDPVSPLQFRKENLEIALLFADAGQPVSIGSMVMGGATGPVTLAGTLALHNAELLATLFLLFAMARQPLCDIYNSGPHSLDLKTANCSFGSPNQALFGIAMAQLARFYGLVPVANCGLTDALQPDFQAGCEKAMTAVFGSLAGLQKIGCQGIVGADQGFSFEQLVLDNEWIGAYNYILNGIEVTEETIAADLVENVGIGGNFLAETHTVSHMRESYYASKLPNRQSWDSWLGSGGKDALAKARDFVETATAGYRTATPVCTGGELQELGRICADARRVQGL